MTVRVTVLTFQVDEVKSYRSIRRMLFRAAERVMQGKI